jgi:transcriptional regulator with XRE-family HTH domain
MNTVSEQEGFSQRLRQALDQAGWKALGASGLAREFNLRSERRITLHAARKWLIGEAIPTQARIQVLAQWLRVPAEWLRFGEGAGSAAAPAAGDVAAERQALVEDMDRLNARQFQLVRELVAVLLGDDRPARTDA